MARLIFACCASLCIGLSSTASVAAQGAPASPPAAGDRTEEAKALFAAGRSAFEAGRYQDALGHFQRCYEISGRAALLYNIGITYDRMRDDEKALASYDAYLAAVPDAENREEVETRSAAIRAALERRNQSAPAASPTAAAAPAPAQAAASVTPANDPAFTSNEAPSEDRESGGLLSQWWFWTAAAVVVAGGVTAGVLLAGGDEREAKPLSPKSGVIVTTLRVAP